MPNPLMMQMLGALIGDKAPVPNVDENGDPIDPNKPYKQPGFGTSLFHPQVAQQIGELNNQAYQAQLANTVRNKVNAGNFSTVLPAFGKPLTDSSISPIQGGLLTGGNETAQNLYGANIVQSAQKEGLPDQLAASESLGLRKKTLSDWHNIQNNVPSLESKAAAASAELVPKQVEAIGQRLAPETAAAIAQSGVSLNNSERQLNAKTTLDKTYRNSIAGLLSDSAVSAARSGQMEKDIPGLTSLQHKSLLNEAWTASHPPADASRFYRTPSGALAINPASMNMTEGITGKMAATPKAVSLGNGLNIITTPETPSISTPLSRPLRGPSEPLPLTGRGSGIAPSLAPTGIQRPTQAFSNNDFKIQEIQDKLQKHASGKVKLSPSEYQSLYKQLVELSK